MGRKLSLDVDQRFEAVLSLVRREEPAVKIARRFGMSEQSLYRLRDQFLQGAKDRLARGAGRACDQDREVENLHNEVAERDRVIGELTIANRLLKKTAHGLY
jgi:transposase-like protein